MADKSKQTMLTAMDFLKENFYKYADMDDDKGTMSKKELADMLRQQLDEVRKSTAPCSREYCERFPNCIFFSFY